MGILIDKICKFIGFLKLVFYWIGLGDLFKGLSLKVKCILIFEIIRFKEIFIGLVWVYSYFFLYIELRKGDLS